MDEYIGIVKLFAGNFAPKGWFFCNGALLPINQYSAFFAIIGTTYGGDGKTTFALPDFRSRVPVGSTDMGGANPPATLYPSGSKAGTESIQLNQTQMPLHTHVATMAGGASNVSVKVSANAATESVPGTNGANTLAAITEPSLGTAQWAYNNDSAPAVPLTGVSSAQGTPGTVTVVPAGSGAAVSIMQPFIGMNYIICWSGIYPTRP